MSVSAILAEKGREVFTANESKSIHEIARALAEKKIGAAVIMNDDGEVCGIASERDIIREIAKSGKRALEESIFVCMTQNVVSCREDDTISTLMDKMTQGRFRHLPVMEGGKLVGIVSIGDVVKRKIKQAEADAEDMKRYIAG